MLYKKLAWPFLQVVDPEVAHDQTLSALSWAQVLPPGRMALRKIAGRIPNKPVEAAGLTFPNVLGIAAGFDKDVRVPEGLGLLGFGHVEVGTLTPRPQKGNPKPRIFRLKEDQALINRMGFPNGGVRSAIPRLEQLSRRDRNYVIGISIGKQKETPLADAIDDYIDVMDQIYVYADYLAVNISSPNTPGLRELQGGKYIGNLLAALQSASQRFARQKGVSQRPMFLKIAPDLTSEELDEILFAIQTQEIGGIIATNTSLSRNNLTSKHQSQMGGLSGQPITEMSTKMIGDIHTRTQGKIPIIGVGGVRSAADVQAKLQAGASLVQIYTGLIYEGPSVAGTILRDLDKLTNNDPFRR